MAIRNPYGTTLPALRATSPYTGEAFLLAPLRKGKSPKRRQWRKKRGDFEEVPRLSATTVAGNRLARRWAGCHGKAVTEGSTTAPLVPHPAAGHMGPALHYIFCRAGPACPAGQVRCLSAGGAEPIPYALLVTHPRRGGRRCPPAESYTAPLVIS